MGVVLYRPGDTHEVNGIKCEMKVFDEYFYQKNLDFGWFMSPDECVSAEDDEEEEEIRPQAKEAGIKNWHTKSIERLKKELSEAN